jgi:transcriptional regulator GlxA family with amidase domain
MRKVRHRTADEGTKTSLSGFADSAKADSIDRGAPAAPSTRPARGVAPAPVTAGTGSGISLAPAVSYVEANYSKKLRLATVAKLCNLTPFQFSRHFKKQNGMNFRAFVVQLRVQRAATLLKESQVSVTEAAFIVGFNDCSYFARMFRRQLGVSPSRYRAENELSQLLLFPQQSSNRNR